MNNRKLEKLGKPANREREEQRLDIEATRDGSIKFTAKGSWAIAALIVIIIILLFKFT